MPHALAAPYDAIGVGFGPSNLALAVALAEQEEDDLRTLFLERKPAFGWHQGLLLEDATMQVHFLKDLATLRNPTSSFSFVSYLHERGRLVDFINHKVFFPTRVEFHDYLEWAAARLADRVHYGTKVVDIRPVGAGGRVDFWDVIARGPRHEQTRTYRTRNVVVATGIVPVLPDGVIPSDRVWHSSELLQRLAEWSPPQAPRFAVVGAGQSAAEAAAHLHQRFPHGEVYAIMSRYGYSVADDSPFANRVFDPQSVDDFYQLSGSVQQDVVAYHANTNYSVVDADLIHELYRRQYQEKVRGRTRLHLMNMSLVSMVEPTSAGVRLAIDRNGTVTDLGVDAAVLATGYRPMDLAAVLKDAAALCEFIGDLPRMDRDYRIRTPSHVGAGIYLLGGTEHSHGLSSSLLSMVAVRAGEVADSITADVRASRARRAVD